MTYDPLVKFVSLETNVGRKAFNSHTHQSLTVFENEIIINTLENTIFKQYFFLCFCLPNAIFVTSGVARILVRERP